MFSAWYAELLCRHNAEFVYNILKSKLKLCATKIGNRPKREVWNKA